ncbi:MAG TPA: FecR domain-containing protein [Polyangiaceae bacterium]
MTTRKTAILRAREGQAAWTELREQRALRGLLSRLRSDEQSAAPRRWPLYAAVAAAVTVMGAGAAFRVATDPAASVVSAPSRPSVQRLELSDGSSLELVPGADAHVVQQAPEAVSVRQLKGRVAYRVSHNPRRAFVVSAGGVEIRVRGTEFTVDFAGDRVAVQVQSGRVEVHDGERVTTLVSGEDLRVHAYSPRQPPAAPAPESSAKQEPAPVSPPSLRSARVAPTTPQADTDRVDALFRTANQARAQGQTGQAAADLRQIVQRYPRDPRVSSAWFTLGRVERSQGNHAAAARSFAACAAAAPGGTLAAEALAEAAAAWLSAGQKPQAARAAAQYLKRFPRGSHAERMRAIVE